MSTQENKSISVQVSPEVLKGVYANQAQVAHTGEEFVMDFFTVVPPAGTLSARVVLSPSHFKRLSRAMEDNLKKYEEQYGTISLAVVPDQKIEFK
jgi:hypothetical protein